MSRRDLFENSVADYPLGDPDVGVDTLEEALDDYWTVGDGRYRDRSAFTEHISSPDVKYENVAARRG